MYHDGPCNIVSLHSNYTPTWWDWRPSTILETWWTLYHTELNRNLARNMGLSVKQDELQHKLPRNTVSLKAKIPCNLLIPATWWSLTTTYSATRWAPVHTMVSLNSNDPGGLTSTLKYYQSWCRGFNSPYKVVFVLKWHKLSKAPTMAWVGTIRRECRREERAEPVPRYNFRHVKQCGGGIRTYCVTSDLSPD